ncbi:MAG: GWxTD domain-containing protein [Candidatus Latescibacterota bacterium]|nr:MAG: GWxTD domain-containing protein [Candidatus Latescibacterota bacterium]
MIAFFLLLILILPIDATVAVAAKTPTYKVKKADVNKLSADMQYVFAGLHYHLNAYQTRQFLSLADDEKRAQWVKRFWELNDPTPTTPENEMMIEHNIRVNLAKLSFPSKKWPGWDKRGEVFIRYGPPDYRGKIWGEVTVKKMYPPGELWYYHRHTMLVAFEEFGRDGEYIYAIDPLGIWENMSPDLIDFLIYDTRDGLAQKIPQNYLEFYAAPTPAQIPNRANPYQEDAMRLSLPREQQEAIDAIMDPDLPAALPKDVSDVFHRDQIREIANNYEIVLEETPATYPFNFNRLELPFYFGVDQFRGGDNSNRVEVSIEVPVVVEGEGGSFEETFHAKVVVWNSQFEEVARRDREIVLRKSADVAGFANLLPTQVVFTLPKGYYRMAVAVRGAKSGAESSYRTSFSCDPFGPDVAISDILFARKIAPTEEVSIFSRGALDVIPHPVRAYSRKYPLPLYFEVYNLMLDRRGVASYTVEYKIIPHSNLKKRFWQRFDETAPVVASEFQSSGYGESETQYIYVGTENLDLGSYDILVTVTDDLTQSVTYRKGTFSIVE